MERLFVDRQCVLVTPLHKMLGQMLELARGKAKHGSTGIGVGIAARERDGVAVPGLPPARPAAGWDGELGVEGGGVEALTVLRVQDLCDAFCEPQHHPQPQQRHAGGKAARQAARRAARRKKKKGKGRSQGGATGQPQGGGAAGAAGAAGRRGGEAAFRLKLRRFVRQRFDQATTAPPCSPSLSHALPASCSHKLALPVPHTPARATPARPPPTRPHAHTRVRPPGCPHLATALLGRVCAGALRRRAHS